MATLVDELDLPRPFTVEGFRATLEQHCHRRVILAATAMPPGAPSGVWLRTAAADYLHYEERTSPFHQAHIVATLAAHLLLADREAEVVSHRLVPDIHPKAGKQFHGTAVGDVSSRPEAETFAFEVLRRTGSFPGTLQSRILLRRLRSLRSALLAAAPSAASDITAETSPGATARLYRSVIEIRDAALALRSYGAEEVASLSHQPQLRSVDLLPRITVEADFLSRDGAPLNDRLRSARFENLLSGDSPADLRAEALALVQAAEAFGSAAVSDDNGARITRGEHTGGHAFGQPSRPHRRGDAN
jgi:hypothetical protein